MKFIDKDFLFSLIVKNRRILSIIGILLLVVSFLFFLYLRIALSANIGSNADDASIIMEAKDVISGNIFLKGWTLPSDTFYTTDLPFYLVGLRLFGLNTNTLHIVPVFLFITMLLLLMIVIYIGTLKRSFQKLLLVVTICAFPTGAFAVNVFRGPTHAATQLFVFLSIILISFFDKKLTRKRLAILLVSLFLISSYTSLGDPLFIVEAIIPIILFAGIKAYQSHGMSQIKYGLLMVIEFLSVGSTFILQKVMNHFGPHIVQVPKLSFLNLDNLFSNFIETIRNLLEMFNANIEDKEVFAHTSISTELHFLIFLSFSALLLYSLYKWKSFIRQDSISFLSLIIFLSSSMGYLFSTLPVADGGEHIRYLFGVFFAGVILVARTIDLYTFRYKNSFLILIFFLSIYLFFKTPIEPANRSFVLTDFLIKHQLTKGYGDYWSATINDVVSQGKVQIAPVINENNEVLAYNWLSTSRWYGGKDKTFIIYENPTPYWLTRQALYATFGKPDTTYLVDGHTILVWQKGLTHKINTFTP